MGGIVFKILEQCNVNLVNNSGICKSLWERSELKL